METSASGHPQGSLPPSSQTLRWGFHCSVHSSFNSLTKSLYLKLGIVLNVCTIRPRLNQLRSSKLNQGFIIELMIRILMPLIYPVPVRHTAGCIICFKSILRCVKESWQYSMIFHSKVSTNNMLCFLWLLSKFSSMSGAQLQASLFLIKMWVLKNGKSEAFYQNITKLRFWV